MAVEWECPTIWANEVRKKQKICATKFTNSGGNTVYVSGFGGSEGTSFAISPGDSVIQPNQVCEVKIVRKP